jgi:hypothetical protein
MKKFLAVIASFMLMVGFALPSKAYSRYEYYDEGRIVVVVNDDMIKVINNSDYNRRCYIYEHDYPKRYVDYILVPGGYVWMADYNRASYGCF